jgi:hypothetical protein
MYGDITKAGTLGWLVSCLVGKGVEDLPNTKTSKVICDMVALRLTIEGDSVFRLRNVDRRRHIVCEAPMLIKVDDD